ncbi:hypothetical protein H4S02_007948, partial [Coemansia sp. RSA 2611]
MKVSAIATCAAFAAGAVALPSRHYVNGAAVVAPVAFDNAQPASVLPYAPVNNELAESKSNRDARREERRKEWQEWAHQTGANGVPNGTNFVAQILDG